MGDFANCENARPFPPLGRVEPIKEDRRLQVRDLVLGLPLTGGEDRCEWDGVVLAARQEISADATKPSEVIVRFNGGLGAT